MDNKVKTIEELAKEKYLRVQLRWEEMSVENATTEELIKARDFINNELKKRGENEQLRKNKKYEH